MSDEISTVGTAESAGATTESQNTNSDATNVQNDSVENTNSDTPNTEKTFTQADVNRIARREAEKARAAALKEIQDKQAESEMSEAQKNAARAEKAENDLALERRERLVDRVANSEFSKLPEEAREEFRALLKGDTEEELRDHAKRLARFTVASNKPNLGLDGALNGTTTSLVSEEEQKRVSSLYGVR